MAKGNYVYVENVKFIQMKPMSIEVIIDGKRVYIPLSQMSIEDVRKFNDPKTKDGSEGHTIAVTQWWADTTEVEYSEEA